MSDLFFVDEAKNFDVNKLELRPGIKSRWNSRCKWATERPDRYRRYIDMLRELVGFERGIKILDVGCGVGTEIIELAHLGADTTGLDAYVDAIHLINQVRDDFGLNLRGVHGDACVLPFCDEAFDVVMSKSFFEHVTDIDVALREQIRVLKSGGRLIIEQASLLNPFSLLDLLIKYPIRTRGRRGGIRWIFNKGNVEENIYGGGWAGKDEDIHTQLWWRKKLKQYSSALELKEFTSGLVKMRGRFFKILAPVLGDILIVAIKQSK